MMQFTDLYPFIISLLIGALIGTERQRRLAEERSIGVAGLRTFTLIALLGTLCANMAVYYSQEFIIVAFGAFMLLVGIGYYSASSRTQGQSRLDFSRGCHSDIHSWIFELF